MVADATDNATHGPRGTPTSPQGRHGGAILAAALAGLGCDRIFGVPGESYLPLLDAMHPTRPQLEFIVCRHESSAVNMAEADAKLTGRPGLCAVSRGPGAMHAAIGVHTAEQDSTPLVLIVGQIPRANLGRGAFQEMDFCQVFASTAKFVAQIEAAADIPDTVARAYRAAMSGRRGPVVLVLPEDVLDEESDVADLPRPALEEASPGAADLQALATTMKHARRPLLVVGGSGWDAETCDELRRFVERHDLPVATGSRCQDLLPTTHANYAGSLGNGLDPALKRRVEISDLIIVLGERLGEVTSASYTLFAAPKPRQGFVHIYPDAAEFGRVYQPDLAIAASPAAFLRAAAALDPQAPLPWAGSAAAAHAAFAAFQVPPPARSAALDLGQAVARLRDKLPERAIICNGAGNYTIWVQRFSRYDGFRTQLAPVSGAMSYGLPAAIAAKLRCPERAVVAFAGDGCFAMAMSEMATAVQHKLNIVVVVANNGQYGSIRMHQERHFPNRPVGSALQNPDFVALAHAFGAAGTRVASLEDLDAALEAALRTDGPALIEIRTDPELTTPTATLAEMRATRQPKAHAIQAHAMEAHA